MNSCVIVGIETGVLEDAWACCDAAYTTGHPELDCEFFEDRLEDSEIITQIHNIQN